MKASWTCPDCGDIVPFDMSHSCRGKDGATSTKTISNLKVNNDEYSVMFTQAEWEEFTTKIQELIALLVRIANK